MMKTFAALLASLLLLAFAGSAMAETFEVKMLNRGEKGPMVFEPDYLEIQPGDKVVFVPTHKSHNAATIDEMIPDGAEGFKSKINEQFETTFDQAGFYGIKCSPHLGMGMVMMIKVGEATMPETYASIKLPPRAQTRMDALIAQVGQGGAQ